MVSIKKVIHISHESPKPVIFKLEVDILGNGNWLPYKSITVPAKGYEFHTFPDGYSA